MDAATRCLREGVVDAAPAPLLLLEDSLATVGGHAVLLQMVGELALCVAQGRAQAQVLTILALDHAPAHYQRLCTALRPAQLSILDCFTDPFGWLAEGGSGHPRAAGSAAELSGVLQRSDGLLQLLGLVVPHAASGLATLPPRRCVIVDSLSRLLDSYGVRAVCQWLHSLQRSAGASCVLCALHADLHPPQALSSLHYLAAGRLQLQPLSDLERLLGAAPAALPLSRGGPLAAGAAPHGRLAVRLKRRAGRVRAEAQLYRVAAGGEVVYWDIPAAVLTPQALAETAVATAAEAAPATGAALPVIAGGRAGEAGAGLALQMEGGMKLSLTREEEEARQRVQLPYEHQGEGAVYQTGDFRDYLPPEAGGHGGAGGGGGARRLGHILYVRDSGSEHDSDEDPDDDLDL